MIMKQIQVCSALLLGALAFNVACRRQPAANQPANANTAQNEQVAPAGGAVATGDTFHFRGTIAGNLRIEMTLIRDGERLSGSYFYPKVGKNIDVKGTIDKDGNVDLKESDESGKQTGVFKGKWRPATEIELDVSEIDGKWSKPDGSKQTAFLVTEQPITFTGPQRIVPKNIKEANKKDHYTIDAEYPQVEGGDARFDKFNKETRNMIAKDVATWKAGEASVKGDETVDYPTEVPDSSFNIGYDIRFATDNLISVEFSEGGYTRGAAHPNSSTAVVNYDLKSGKKLALADLFKPKSNYLSVISTYCIKNLKEQSRKKDLMLEDDTIQTGASAKADNYKAWAITKKGLWITFDPYQVGPYAAGPQYVLVPYSSLKDLINPEGPIGSFAK
jgi:Protein of unknown function (DUF3298)/Deacetylase PdaC